MSFVPCSHAGRETSGTGGYPGSMTSPISDGTGDDALYAGEPVSARTARWVSAGLAVLIVGFLLYMILAATVLKGREAPGVSYRELKGQPIYRHQPPQSRDVRLQQGASGLPGGSANRWVVREYVTKIDPQQTRAWYLRQWGASYGMADSAQEDTAAQRILRGTLVLSERTSADPPTLAVRVAIAREMVEERTRVTLSIESNY